MEKRQTAATTRKKDDLIVICGAGGFIAGALTRYFFERGFTRLRAVDKKPLPEWYQRVPGVENLSLDLSDEANCKRAVEGAVEVYNLAADMGGMGFIERFRVECLRSVLINTHLIEAAYWAALIGIFSRHLPARTIPSCRRTRMCARSRNRTPIPRWPSAGTGGKN